MLELVPPLADAGMARGRGGGKVSPETMAAGLNRGLARDAREVVVGRARAVRGGPWLAPVVAGSMMRGRH